MDECNSTTSGSVVSPKEGNRSGMGKGKRKKTYATSSHVWDHYDKVKNDEGLVIEAVCKYCSRVFATCNDKGSFGTSTLMRHVYNSCKEYQKSLASHSSTDNSDQRVVGSRSTFNQDFCRKELACMIIIDELPFSFVEKEGFKRFVNALRPEFQLVSRTTITKDCISIYMSEKAVLKKVFENSVSLVCFTTDLWTSIQTLGYMCLTAHYIDKNWRLQKRIINFRVLPTPHKGENIAQAIRTCLKEWGLRNRVCTITVDNASSNDVALSKLKIEFARKYESLLDGECMHVRCFAHVLNLIVKKGIEEVKELVLRVRDYVKYVRSSPSRLQVFKQCAEEEMVVAKRSLCLDVQTRWNSTYLMLTTALEYQRVFERLEEHDRNFIVEVGHIVMEEDWMTVKSLTTFLEQFYVATNRVSGAKYVTSNICFREMNRIQGLISSWAGNDNEFFRSMAQKMRKKFDKYCSIEKINPLLIIAVILDPCYKLKYVKFSLAKYYPTCDQKEVLDGYKSLMDRLYGHYSPVVVGKNVDKFQSGKNAQMEDICSDMDVDQHTREWQQFLKLEESLNMKSEWERYLGEDVEASTPDFDILAWWKLKSPTYPVLSLMARDILAIPISTVASESAFSTGGRVLDSFRSSLTPRVVECLLCTQDWLRSPSTQICVEEQLEELENVESSLAEAIATLTLASQTSSAKEC